MGADYAAESILRAEASNRCRKRRGFCCPIPIPFPCIVTHLKAEPPVNTMGLNTSKDNDHRQPLIPGGGHGKT